MSETAAQREVRVRSLSSDKRTCRVCGLLPINVVHEPDPDNAPEGRDYYASIRDRLHAFVPFGSREGETPR